jgi:hypothetical protein
LRRHNRVPIPKTAQGRFYARNDEQAKDAASYREAGCFVSAIGASIAKSYAAKIALDKHMKAATADSHNAHLSDRVNLADGERGFAMARWA